MPVKNTDDGERLDVESVIYEPVFVDLPPMKPQQAARIFLIFIILIPTMAIYAAITRGVSMALTLIIVIAALGVAMVPIFIAHLIGQYQLHRKYLELPILNPTRKNASIQYDMRELQGFIHAFIRARRSISFIDQGFWSRSKLDKELRWRQIPHLSTIVTKQLSGRLGNESRSNVMLEPEFIVSSKPQNQRAMLIICALAIFTTILQFSSSFTLFGIIQIGCILYILTTIPAVRNRIPGLRMEEIAPIAGLGVLQDRKGRRWTVNDSTMFIWSKTSTSPLLVWLAGPPGWKLITFANADDPDFINLWQRWAHPKPRPELLERMA